MNSRNVFITFVLVFSVKFATTEDEFPENPFETEYWKLYDLTEDKSGLESIRILHKQLDDDNDGAIEPSETCDFLRADLKKDRDQQQLWQNKFHGKDAEITVKDLWITWRKGEVHNWTVDQTVNWLVHNVELPQYEPNFRRHAVDGAKLPQVASGSSSFLSKTIGVTNPIHRSKISLKAMDVVLFGPPKEIFNTWKDVVFTTLLLLAVSGLFLAYRQNKKSQDHLRKMTSDMESLSRAEEELQHLMSKLQQKDSKIESNEAALQQQQQQLDSTDVMEVSRLREQVEVLRIELQRAEIELEDRCWIAPPVLQHWLQITYELETQVYNAKKKAAEDQLEMAKDLCEKLKKKRSSLVGAFVSTHGCSVDEVDKSILEAKKSLLDVTQDLSERTQRWRQIEALCGCPITTNPGLGHLKSMVKNVVGGRMASSASGTRILQDLSPDDGSSSEDPLEDARSVAASHFSTARATLTSSVTMPSLLTLKSGKSSTRHTILESSKESLLVEEAKDSRTTDLRSLAFLQRNTCPNLHNSSNVSFRIGNGLLQPKVGPGGRMIVKSFSHGAGSSMATTVAAMVTPFSRLKTSKIGGKIDQQSGLSASVSETHLQSNANQHNEASVDSAVGVEISDSTMTSDALDGSTQVDDLDEDHQVADNVESEDSGSGNSDLDNVEKSTKKSTKLKKFFNFSRKKRESRLTKDVPVSI